MKVAEYIVKFLEDKDYRLIFGLPGWNILPLYDVIRDSNIEHLLVKHENSASIMADVYGRLTGKPGICIVTAGPGATNSITGIAGAFAASSPVLHLSGHCPSDEKVQPFHGVDDWFFLEKMFKPITKFSKTIINANEVPKILNEAYKISISGRPGPVHISFPMDILNEETTESYGEESEMIEESNNLVMEFIKLIPRAFKPAILVGQGVLRSFCWNEIVALAEKINAPIFFSRWGRSAIPFNHPLNVGYFIGLMFGRRSHPMINELFNDSDLIFTIGFEEGSRYAIESMLGDKPTFHIFQENSEYRISITERSIQLNVKSLKQALNMLIKYLPEKIESKWIDIKSRITKIKMKIESELKEMVKEHANSKPIHPSIVINCINELSDENTIITTDIGSNFVWTELYYRIKSPNSFIVPGRYGSMGFSLPAAISAKKINMDKQVIAITGDGGMLMMMNELATLYEQKLNIPIIVMNDSKYGILWKIQQMHYGGRFFAVDICSPNFAECAEAFGIKGIKVEEPNEVYSVIEEALSSPNPVLVDIDLSFQYDFYKYRL